MGKSEEDMENEIRMLRKTRGMLKGQLTRFDNFLGLQETRENKSEIETRLKKIESYFEQFDSVQSSLEQLVEEEEESREEQENRFYEVIARAKTLLAQSAHGSQSNNNNEGVLNSESDSLAHLKLPSINLPIFSGNFEDWITFHDSFSQLINNNEKLTNVQRFYYLISSVKHDALKFVQTYKVTSDNYSIVWNALVKRYEKRRIIINKHVTSLIEYPSITKEVAHSLRQLIDTFYQHVSALLKFGIILHDAVLVNLITLKLDSVSRSDWEDTIDDDNHSELPSYEHIMKFLNKRCTKLENLQGNKRALANFSNKPQGNQIKGSQYYSSREKSSTFAVTNQETRIACHYCKENHYIYSCPGFYKLSLTEKYDEVKKLRLCLNCLRPGHAKWECRSSSCKRCNLKHNTLLHNYDNREGRVVNFTERTATNVVALERTRNSTEGGQREYEKECDAHLNSSGESQIVAFNTGVSRNLILLSTARILIYDQRGQVHTCRALLVSGSQSNIITQKLAKKLNLKCKNVSLSISGVNQNISNINQMTNARIGSRINSFQVELPCLVLPSITGKIPNRTFNNKCLEFPTNIELADPDFNISQEIEVLLGAGIFYDLLGQAKYQLGPGLPNLQETSLGWILTGKLTFSKSDYEREKIQVCNLVQISNEALNENLTQFWNVEEIPQEANILTPEAQICEDYFKATTIRNTEGRFVVRLPFSENVHDLGDSRSTALKRFRSLESKFERDENLKSDYQKFMREYEKLGHMSLVGDLKLNELPEQPSYILPHHAVLKKNSSTTKCRVVFDASAKTSLGMSLNDKLLIGYTVQDELFSIVMRLRLFRYVLSADVKMMFRQILVHPDDRKYQQILWRSDKSDDIKLYSLNTVTYGTSSAPFLATRVLHQLATENETTFPRTCKILKTSFYMDDLLVSLDTIEEALELFDEISRILNSGGFQLRKWSSNEKVILDHILGDSDNSDKMVEIRHNKELKTLGLAWVSNTDTLNYEVNIDCNTSVLTKRIVLATISRIFDPLGLIGPAIIKAKIFMQHLWQMKVDWDEPLPAEMFDSWHSFLNQLQSVNHISINRHIAGPDSKIVELHGFSDASERAYGACLYIVSSNENGERFSNLLCAKSRVAPQKKCTLPRLELLAAALLARLAHSVIKILDIHFQRTVFYSDSTIVLAWLNLHPSRLKTFVANRVSEITKITNIENWRHVSSENNAADIISRGITPNELLDNTLWWHGPDIVMANKELNQEETYKLKDTNMLPDIKTTIFNLVSIKIDDLDIFERYSSLTRLQRVIAYCCRFKQITLKKQRFESTVLMLQELDYALTLLVKLAQCQDFQAEIVNLKTHSKVKSNSKLLNLHPFIDKDGVVRVGGRLTHSDLDYTQKHPIILPKKHKLTRLIIKHEHLKKLHAGTQTLLSIIRLRYWPIDGKNTVKGVIRSCIRYYKTNPNPVEFLMGDLPSARVTPSRPFSKCGVDYAGPILVKDRTLRNAKLVKTYICIFVCFCTQAVHIELASDLSTEGFLNVLKRFIARRGKPSEIHSDNGLNFVGANNYFIELYNLLQNQVHAHKIQTFLSSDKIKWSFIPPKSPHVGGLWEAAVKSAKFHLKRILGNASVTYEEMLTVLTQIEACLNSRPLSPISNDPHDSLPLTPAHFLIGNSLVAAPQEDLREVPISKLSRYQRMQHLAQQFWSRWKHEYLTQLQQRTKWKFDLQKQLKVGALVILIEDNTPPLRWPMGRITQLHQGADNVTRVVSVKLSNGSVFKRSVCKICILPVDETD